MAIPAEVEVLGQTFTVKHETPSDDGAGECHSDKNLIRVNPAHGVPAQRDTLLHEITHAISDAMALNLSERAVRLMATGMLCVLRSNPDLINYLTDP